MAFYVAAHKYFDFDIPDGYVPLYVGAAQNKECPRKAGWLYDDSAPSISNKNDRFCELTGLYWLWKHCDDDIIGLVHYRRFFQDATTGTPLTLARGHEILEDYDAIVVQRTIFHYGEMLFNVARHYRIYHSSLDFRILKNIISDYFPEYLNNFEECCSHPWLHARNMFLMKNNLFNEYCEFLFGVLAKLEHAIDPYSNRDVYQRRVFGFIGERLLDVFLLHKNAKIWECRTFDPAGNLEPDEDPSSVVAYFPRKPPLLARFFKPQFEGIDFSTVFEPGFCMQQWPESTAGHARKPKYAFDWFLDEGLKAGLQAHPYFNVSSYRNAHSEWKDALGDDPCAWCLDYIERGMIQIDNERQLIDEYAFGYENFDFSVGDCSSELEGELGIDGDPLLVQDFISARIRAAREGIVG